jgi:hypothetical protein
MKTVEIRRMTEGEAIGARDGQVVGWSAAPGPGKEIGRCRKWVPLPLA